MKALALVVAAAISYAPVAARADSWSGTVPAKARALADRGRAFHDAGEYDKAIAAFTQAYAMAPSPALLFNLAQAYRLQGNCDTAALMYRRYLASNANPEGRALAEAHLANVERCVRKLALHIPTEPPPDNLVLPAPDELTTTTARPSRTARIEKDIGIGLGVGGGIALAVATYYAVQAHDAESDVAAAYAKGAKWKDIAPLDARGKSAASTARIFGAGGALGVASGVAMYLIGRHTERPPVAVAPRSHGVEVTMLWTF
jgi:tetratricopeptide (TPR) repeat protein